MQSAADSVTDSHQLIRLWCHEAMRVFHDRLVDDNDRKYLVNLIANQCDEAFRVRMDKVMLRPPASSQA